MRIPLTDYCPAIVASTKPILPARPTLRAQRQAAGEFKRDAEIEDKSDHADETTIRG